MKISKDIGAHFSEVLLISRSLYRMRQLYEAYRQKQFVSAVLTQISWTNHMIIRLLTEDTGNNHLPKPRKKLLESK